MMMQSKIGRKRGIRGMTILEVMVMSTIVLTIASAITGLLINSLKLINRNRARAFALEKCNQMIEEITAYSLAGEDVIELDRFKDISPSAVLTADTTITLPGNFLSGNIKDSNGNWKYLRMIDIIPIIQEPRARIVSVRVYFNDKENPGQAGDMLAQLTKLLKTAGDIFPPSHVYDVYAIAVESTPGWWVDMSVMKPMMHEAMNQVQARNPGLEYRVHWITRNGFGRDPYYSPYFNNAKDATASGALPYAYIFPSAIVGEDGFYYYSPKDVNANKTVDGTKQDNGVYPYPLADYYNHAVRYPEEISLYNAMTTQYKSSGYTAPNPSLPHFLQDMYDNPENYKNVLIFNLHGELLPLPPTRNYSDPAKSPQNRPRLRVVSHPEKLYYVTGENVRFRVYAYYTDPDSFPASSAVDTICLFYPGVNLTGSGYTIYKCEGCDTMGYGWRNADSSLHYDMTYTSLNSVPGTLIELYDTPSRAPWNPVSGSSGSGSWIATLHAEDGTLIGGTKARKEGTSYPPDHTGYNGTGFVDQFSSSGRGVSWAWSPEEEGDYEIVTRYGNAMGSNARRTIWVKRFGSWQSLTSHVLPSLANWDTWGEVSSTAYLTTDITEVKIEWSSGDYQHINLDELKIIPQFARTYDIQLSDSYCQSVSTPGNFVFNFTSLPRGVKDDGVLRIQAKGDISSSNEYYKVYADGELLGNVLNYSLTDCQAGWLPSPAEEITLSKTDLERWVSNKAIQFTVVPSSNINSCSENCVQIEFAYDTTALNLGPGGLDAAYRLYGLEYIPCPVEAANDFSQDLTNATQAAPKNTARWIVEFPDAGFPDTTVAHYYTFIGPKSDFGTPVYNRSLNFVWRSIPPPVCEQLQTVGDPRHMPYSDIKTAHGYNWFFNTKALSGYGGFTKSYNKLWKGESQRIDVDLPKAMMMLRHAIISADAIWNSMTGHSNYYFGLGQEIGGDEANHAEYTSGIPMETSSWKTEASPSNKIDEITTAFERSRLPAAKDGTWKCFPWLGEIFPDTYWNSWVADGNLSNVDYYRIPFSQADWGGDLSSDEDRVKRTQGLGCVTFFNAVPKGTAASSKTSFTHFHYSYTDQSNITTVGESLATRFKIPLSSTMLSARPFVNNSTSPIHGWPDEWTDSYYQNLRCESEFGNIYYTYGTNKASAILNLFPPSSQADLAGHCGHYLLNGLSPSKDQGASWIVMFGIASMTQAFLDEGHPSKAASSRIHQLPRLEIIQPDPNSAVKPTFTLNWEVEWSRWDGLSYSHTYPSGFQETDELIYTVKYTPDGGRHWFYKSDNTPTATGERPDLDHSITAPPISLTFSKEGAYILRVECFRKNIITHYSYHQIRVLVLNNA